MSESNQRQTNRKFAIRFSKTFLKTADDPCRIADSPKRAAFLLGEHGGCLDFTHGIANHSRTMISSASDQRTGFSFHNLNKNPTTLRHRECQKVLASLHSDAAGRLPRR